MNDASNELNKVISGHLQEALPDVPVYTSTGPATANERDTHFQCFAKLLLREIDLAGSMSPGDYSPYRFEKARQLVIARRAYDLAVYLVSHADVDPEGASAAMLIASIPDMTELP
jgi:hypothetical protein